MNIFTYKNNNFYLVDHITYKGVEYDVYLGEKGYLFLYVDEYGRTKVLDSYFLINEIKDNEGMLDSIVKYLIHDVLFSIIAPNKEKLSDKETNDIKDIYMKIVNEYKKYYPNIETDKIKKNLENIIIYKADLRDSKGCYVGKVNSVAIQKNVGSEEGHILVHELTHASSGKDFGSSKYQSNGIIEGMTESFASYVDNKDLGTLTKNLKFNDYTIAYAENVSLVRQMEYAINMSSIESILNGKYDFRKAFIDKYGEEIYAKVSHKSSNIINPKKKESRKEIFLEIQEELMKTIFNTDIKEVKDENAVFTYIERLKNYEALTGRPTNEEYKVFEDFYNEKLEECVTILQGLGYDERRIKGFRLKYAYQKYEFRSIRTAEESLNILMDKVSSELAEYIKKYKLPIDFNDLKLYFVHDFDDRDALILENKDQSIIYAEKVENELSTVKMIYKNEEVQAKTPRGYAVNVKGKILRAENITTPELLKELNDLTYEEYVSKIRGNEELLNLFNKLEVNRQR